MHKVVSRCLFNVHLVMTCGQLLLQMSHLHRNAFTFLLLKIDSLILIDISPVSLEEIAVEHF